MLLLLLIVYTLERVAKLEGTLGPWLPLTALDFCLLHAKGLATFAASKRLTFQDGARGGAFRIEMGMARMCYAANRALLWRYHAARVAASGSQIQWIRVRPGGVLDKHMLALMTCFRISKLQTHQTPPSSRSMLHPVTTEPSAHWPE